MNAMTQLLTRPVLRVETQANARPRRSLVGSAALAAAVASGTGLLVAVALAVAAWFSADSGSFGGAVRIGALGWLVSQGGGLHVDGAGITLVPLGGCAVGAWMLHRGGRWAGAGEQSAAPLALVLGAAVFAGGYGAIGLAVLAATHSSGAHADLLRTALVLPSLALVAGGTGLVRGAGRTGDLLGLLPRDVRVVLAGAAAGVASMLFAGTVLLTGSLVVHFSSAVTLAENMHAGMVGGVVLALVGAAAVPIAVLCSGAYLTGAGFAVGAGTTVAPHLVMLGPLPTFPLLTALPHSAGAWWQTAMVVSPLLAGAVAGAVVVRQRRCSGYVDAVLWAAAAGLMGGVGFGLCTWLATGSLGSGRLHHIGPDVLATLFVSAVGLCLGAAVSGLIGRWVASLRSTPSDETRSVQEPTAPQAGAAATGPAHPDR